jgi:hypothetical protein
MRIGTSEPDGAGGFAGVFGRAGGMSLPSDDAGGTWGRVSILVLFWENRQAARTTEKLNRIIRCTVMVLKGSSSRNERMDDLPLTKGGRRDLKLSGSLALQIRKSPSIPLC